MGSPTPTGGSSRGGWIIGCRRDWLREASEPEQREQGARGDSWFTPPPPPSIFPCPHSRLLFISWVRASARRSKERKEHATRGTEHHEQQEQGSGSDLGGAARSGRPRLQVANSIVRGSGLYCIVHRIGAFCWELFLYSPG